MVSCLRLAHNGRHPRTGSPVAKVIHNFGRADKVDREVLARLVALISRFLQPEQAVAAAAGAEVEVIDSRRLGGCWVLGRIWERLEIGRVLWRVAAGRRLDGEATERVIFALVAQRALEPASKLAATRWVAERVAVEGCPGFSEDAAYAAMGFLLDALGGIACQIFSSVAHLLNLDLGIVFAGTTSTCGECGVADELAELADEPVDDGISKPAGSGARTFGHSKDHRDDLPRVVIAMAVTRDGIAVRCWSFPGGTSGQEIIRTVKDGLDGWKPAPPGMGRRPGVCLRRQPGLPHQGRRALHPRREAAAHQRRSRCGAGPPGPLPHRGREPAGQGGVGACPCRRGAGRAVRDLPQPQGRRA